MNDTDAELKRLRWRCRRGTRELDQLLGWWLDKRYAEADEELRRGFADLLEQPDPDVWDWLVGRGAPLDARQLRVIDEIRSHHRV
ncbi:MAG TPA: succinate dehydrogenase assembly factor 2 [Dokdonella sp.]|uniref:FAD assembly factor SdhE n=1 Tax=Dokdonella sp. TaxID=2291710 RepID=UPI002D7F5EC2|nr:succinate dehydrogenase assembly factor 2 [Dokdonella sp.]HET9034530.1 succinate dehydrogenase assembly factor 2 [Dokdonella sp.]